jgi:hypothetical protein
VACGSRTRLARLEAWHLCRSAKATFEIKAEVEGVEPPRLLRSTADHPADGAQAAAIAGTAAERWSGLYFHWWKAPVAGLEPAVGLSPRRINSPIPATNSGTPDHVSQDGWI